MTNKEEFESNMISLINRAASGEVETAKRMARDLISRHMIWRTGEGKPKTAKTNKRQ